MSEETFFLPPTLQEIADAAGLVAALKLAEARGGTGVYFPPRARDGHWLVECVGREAADKICAHFSDDIGVRLLIPLGPHRFYQRACRTAVKLLEEGVNQVEVARRLGVHLRTVQRVAARRRDLDDPQGRLF
ncbi:helix-turn-helix domain-containing protein [Methylocystis heyeri]|uniref:Helix-turn-helix domain-containing protein n=1 Tax=Methylocystis heyeri TaxID=391905 RepID=A0A6B8KG56_9HYPH|nr:helix-turn-helix domain-containing protein [Methylocystis heyeri]QGM46717.1 helix-turn-helix domain-containing protein [Methylocystis heyeri]